MRSRVSGEDVRRRKGKVLIAGPAGQRDGEGNTHAALSARGWAAEL